MRPLFLQFIFALFLCAAAGAQPAETYFHRGAQAFVHEQRDEALSTVEEGLDRHPDSKELQALRKAILRQQQSSSQGSSGESSQQQQSSDQTDRQPNNQQQNQGQNQPQNQDQRDQQSDQSNTADQPEQQTGQQDKENQQQDQQPSPSQDQSDDPSNAGPRKIPTQPSGATDQMSRQQAIRILQALEQQERKLLREVTTPKPSQSRAEKDW